MISTQRWWGASAVIWCVIAMGVIELAAGAEPAGKKLRLIIETDAGGDPDDEQSLVRFLLYSNEWDIEGIIANRPDTRDGENLNKERTGLGVVRQLVSTYGVCRTNLVHHDSRYPTGDYLLQRTVSGYNHQEEAVNLIIAALDRNDERPLWYSDWGTDHGASTNNMKRALDRLLRERGSEKYAALKSKLRLTSYDMYGDHTTRIGPPFKLLVNTFQPPMGGKRWYHRFSELTAKAGGFDVKRDVLTGHGPLGALYPLNTTHAQKEGDSPTFLYLVPTGANDPEQPTWGSWAGRYGLNTNYPGMPYYWASVVDSWRGTTNRDNTLLRWVAALQNDFRARLDWCVKGRDEANHPPQPRVEGGLQRTVAAGESVELSAEGSTDPDGNALSYAWELYPEASGFRGQATIENADRARARLIAPQVKEPATLHVLLSVTDGGSPPLSRYARVIVTVKP